MYAVQSGSACFCCRYVNESAVSFSCVDPASVIVLVAMVIGLPQLLNELFCCNEGFFFYTINIYQVTVSVSCFAAQSSIGGIALCVSNSAYSHNIS